MIISNFWELYRGHFQTLPLVISAMTAHANSHFKLRELPSFPRTLFAWRQYDGGKTIVAILLAFAAFYFMTGFVGFLIEHNQWIHDWIYPPQPTVETSPPHWWNRMRFFNRNPIGEVIASAFSYADILFRLAILLCAYCLTWATFDPRNIEGYAMGLFNTCVGAAYVLSPADLIPDVFPIVGSFDDTVFGVGMTVLGVSAWYRTKMRDLKTKTVLELVDHGNTQRALQLLLEDKGISIEMEDNQTKG